MKIILILHLKFLEVVDEILVNKEAPKINFSFLLIQNYTNEKKVI
jgi:hypothetical protein